uniref:WAP domain-containing protein n=1 Tax=Chelydra serpentina TaxID=8475 RepID=A0A8C3SH54_CHESE
ARWDWLRLGFIFNSLKNGECPAPINGAAATCDNFCSIDSDCPGSERCCSNGCGRKCKLPIGGEGFSFSTPTFAPCENKCEDDWNCPIRQKCCFTGCGLGCLECRVGTGTKYK